MSASFVSRYLSLDPRLGPSSGYDFLHGRRHLKDPVVLNRAVRFDDFDLTLFD